MPRKRKLKIREPKIRKPIPPPDRPHDDRRKEDSRTACRPGKNKRLIEEDLVGK